MKLSVEQVLAINAMSGAKKAALVSMVTEVSKDVSSFEDFFAFVKEIKPACTKYELENLLQIAKRQVSLSKESNIHIISVLDQSYPRMLNGIPNQPLVLFAKGNVSLLNADLSIAIVGTREASECAVQSARSFAKSMADEGVCIVSGLALGCDTAAHAGALAASITGKTIAVMAHGLHIIYPKKNEVLAKNIIKNDGCLVSEHAPGVGIQKRFFVERNRIQSGLSVATVVIQTGTSGGTISTARHCLKQNRLLACMAPPKEDIENADYAGNKQLIAEGAKVVKGVEDIKLLISNNTSSASALILDNDLREKKRKRNYSGLQQSITKYIKPNPLTSSNTSSEDLPPRVRVLTSSSSVNQKFKPPGPRQTPAFNNAIGAASSNTQPNAKKESARATDLKRKPQPNV